MIDIESTVFDRVAEALEEKYGAIYVASVPLAGAPPELPAVCLWEQSNVALAASQTAQSRENHAKLMYQCEVYSNLDGEKKQQARELAAAVDEVMESMGFIRTFGQPVPNLADMTIYRYTTRYEGIIGTDNVLYTS